MLIKHIVTVLERICRYRFWLHKCDMLNLVKKIEINMAHCPSCGKEVNKPSNILKNHCLTVKVYDCRKCHHNFKVTINQSEYMYNLT